MKILSWNVNGIRAVERKKELQAFLDKEQPDLLFIQETKAQPEQLSDFLTANENFYQFYNSAEKKGYSGVSVWASKNTFKKEPQISTGMPGWDDHEGRIIRLDNGRFTFIGGYFPNGGKSEAAWEEKLVFYDHFLDYVNTLRSEKRKVIWAGDLNVAHNEIDLARPKENEKNIGFLPEERSWVDRVIAAGWIDIFRKRNPDKESYTWWSLQTRARARNVGWRIDYIMIDPSLEKKVKDAGHLNEQMGSDHCPVYLDIDL